MGKNKYIFKLIFKVEKLKMFQMKPSADRQERSIDEFPCQDRVFQEVFCSETYCDDNYENYTENDVMTVVDKYKYQQGCGDIQVCGYNRHGLIQSRSGALTPNVSLLLLVFIFIKKFFM